MGITIDRNGVLGLRIGSIDGWTILAGLSVLYELLQIDCSTAIKGNVDVVFMLGIVRQPNWCKLPRLENDFQGRIQF